MVSLGNSAVLAAATLVTCNAVATLDFADEQTQLIELTVYIQDVANNMEEYLSFFTKNPQEPFPHDLVVDFAKADGIEDHLWWTTDLTPLDPSLVERLYTGVPWYSDRLLPALTARFAKEGIVVDGTTADETKTTTKETAKKTSMAAETSSAKATETTSVKGSTTAKASSKGTETTSVKASSTAEASFKATTAQAVSQITDGQIQATKTVEQQTENGAAKAVAGLGAGVLAAGVLLI